MPKGVGYGKRTGGRKTPFRHKGSHRRGGGRNGGRRR